MTRHHLAVALMAAGAAPGFYALNWLVSGVSLAAGGAVAVASWVFLFALPATVPLTLASLASYRRQTPACRARAGWTTVVSALLIATAVPLGVFVLN